MTADQYAFAVRQIRGVQAEIESEMNAAERSGRGAWCDALRNMQSGDLGVLISIEMLNEFAAAAPSAYLQGFVLGLIAVCTAPGRISRESAKGMLLEAGSHSSPVERGSLAGNAFLTIRRLRVRRG